MTDTPVKSSKRALEPYDRVSEVLFGLIMVLTFTGSLSVAESGRDDVRVMLIGALGCNLAWGIIDAVLYLMGCLAEKGRTLMTFKAVRNSTDPQKGQQVIANAMPPALASVLQPAELETIRVRLRELPEPARPAKLDGSDWRGAVAVFLLVFLSTFPVAVPFIFVQDMMTAMRLSNLVAVGMLFGTGFAFGRCVGRSPWMVGVTMVILGSVLVGITMALGG
jgi:hypothetical protein